MAIKQLIDRLELVNDPERELLLAIGTRARQLAIRVTDKRIPSVEFTMFVQIAHRRIHPLQLAELLAAPDFDFAHDVFGIYEHVNTHTCKYDRCFWPRFSATDRTPEVPLS